jgi:cytochrome bd-type quinol oxidase subunit 2
LFQVKYYPTFLKKKRSRIEFNFFQTMSDADQGNRSWQLIAVAVISYLIFIATSSLTVWIAYKTNGYKSSEIEKGVKGGSLLLLIVSILMPVIYMAFTYRYLKTSPGAQIQDVALSRRAILIIMMTAFALMIIAASFGIWLANTNMNWSSNSQENTVKIIFIIILVLACILPCFYALFFYREALCREILRGKNKSV